MESKIFGKLTDESKKQSLYKTTWDANLGVLKK